MARMPNAAPASVLKLLLALAAFLVVGGPAVFFFWRELSELLYGRFGQVHLPILVSAALVFGAVLLALATYVRRLAATGEGSQGA